MLVLIGLTPDKGLRRFATEKSMRVMEIANPAVIMQVLSTGGGEDLRRIAQEHVGVQELPPELAPATPIPAPIAEGR